MSGPESKTARSEFGSQKESGAVIVKQKATKEAGASRDVVYGPEIARRVFDTSVYPGLGFAPYLTIQGGTHGAVQTTATVRTTSRVLLSMSFPIQFLNGSVPNVTFEVRRHNKRSRETVSITRRQLLIAQRSTAITNPEAFTYTISIIDRRAPPGTYTYTLLIFNNQLPLPPILPESIFVTVPTMSFQAIPHHSLLFARQRTPPANTTPPPSILSIHKNPPRVIRKTVELFSHPIVHDTITDVSSNNNNTDVDSNTNNNSGGSSSSSSNDKGDATPLRRDAGRTARDGKRDVAIDVTKSESDGKAQKKQVYDGGETKRKPKKKKVTDEKDVESSVSTSSSKSLHSAHVVTERVFEEEEEDGDEEDVLELESKTLLEAPGKSVAGTPYPVSIIATLAFSITLPKSVVGNATLNYQFLRSRRPFGKQFPIGSLLPALQFQSSATTVTIHQTIQVSTTDLLNMNERTTYGILLQNASSDPRFVFHLAWYSLIIGDIGGIGPQPNLYTTASLPDVSLGQIVAFIPNLVTPTPIPPLVSTSALALAFSTALVTTSFAVESVNRLLPLIYDIRRDGRSIVNGPQTLTHLDLGITPSAPVRTVITVTAYDKTVAPGTHVYSFIVQDIGPTFGVPQVEVKTYLQTIALLEISPPLFP
jgi:hypothetical protein